MGGEFASGLSIFLAYVAGAALPLIKDWLNNRHQFRIERLKLHDSARVEAYKRVALFAGKISGSVFPLAEDKQSAFNRIMRKHYLGQIEQDYIYFNSRIQGILDEFEEQYVCMNRLELIPETEAEREQFLEKRAFDLAQSLRQEAREAFELSK